MSFPQFTSFPLEIQGLVMDACPPNDRTCLSLTCKYLYNLSTSTAPIDLKTTDTGHLCGEEEAEPSGRPIWRNAWIHRPKCHKASYEAICKRNAAMGRSTPPMKPKCRTSYGSYHCECYTRRNRLHFRLKSWMPQGLNFCAVCNRFTKRKRGHNGRCYHGRKKLRRYEGNLWAHSSRRGSFGRKLWKKWFNNRAFNRMEARIRLDDEYGRAGSSRYDMRKLAPRNVDTRVERDNHALL